MWNKLVSRTFSSVPVNFVFSCSSAKSVNIVIFIQIYWSIYHYFYYRWIWLLDVNRLRLCLESLEHIVKTANMNSVPFCTFFPTLGKSVLRKNHSIHITHRYNWPEAFRLIGSSKLPQIYVRVLIVFFAVAQPIHTHRKWRKQTHIHTTNSDRENVNESEKVFRIKWWFV